MEYRRTTSQTPMIVFDEGGDFIQCKRSSLEDLVLSTADVTEVRARRHGGKLDAAMKKIVDHLYAMASGARSAAEGEESFEFMCCAISDAYAEVRECSRMHILTGLSPDTATLFVIFAPPSIHACIVRAGC